MVSVEGGGIITQERSKEERVCDVDQYNGLKVQCECIYVMVDDTGRKERRCQKQKAIKRLTANPYNVLRSGSGTITERLHPSQQRLNCANLFSTEPY